MIHWMVPVERMNTVLALLQILFNDLAYAQKRVCSFFMYHFGRVDVIVL